MKKKEREEKTEALRKAGALNRHANRVTDACFAQDDFFDVRDIVQVKYEMLRRVWTDHSSVTETAEVFGLSRFSFYQAQSAYEEAGMAGLLAKKPGPQGRHKMTPEIVQFVKDEKANNPTFDIKEMPSRISARYGISVHQRTVERALEDDKKKLKPTKYHPRKKDEC